MTSPHTSLVADSGSKPKIGLEDLPQELRDQIYDYVIGGSYCVDHQPYICHIDLATSGLSNYALFQTSKRVRNDAMKVCFSKVEFCWLLTAQYRCDYWCKLKFPAKRLLKHLPTDRLMNILLVFEMGACFWYSVNSSLICDFIQNFSGAEILREKMRIRFEKCSSSTHIFTSTPYFQALTALTGFRTVVVEVLMTYTNSSDTEQLSDCKHLQTAIKDVLEPALGPAIIETAKLDKWGWFHGFCFLEFHPRQHSTKLIGNATAEYPHRDPCGFQPNTEFPRQMKSEATRARDYPRSRAESKAHSASLSKESKSRSSDADSELNSLMQSSSIDEAGW